MHENLAVWDLDNTVIASKEGYKKALEDFCAERRFPLDFARVEKGYSRPLVNDLGWGIPLEEQPAILNEYQLFFQSNLAYLPPLYDGAFEALKSLSAICDQGIITTSYRESMNFSLREHKIVQYFMNYRTLCCTRERGYDIKPAPDALRCLIAETGHLVENTVVIGDSADDITMAHALGAKSIGALWGADSTSAKEKLLAAKPTMLVENIAHIPQTLNKLWRIAA